MSKPLSVVDLKVSETASRFVPAGAAHGFASSGSEVLRQVGIHPSDHVVQEWLEK